jgi:tetratricopeptide (TPR) repeat protein
LLLLVFLAWSNSFAVPLVFDDVPSLAANTSIRQLWPLGVPFSPPDGGATVAGRPLLNFTFAINYAVSGQQVWSYHLGNLLIHALAALVLFGLVRRTLLLGAMREDFARSATTLAFAVAAIWALHPLQTESVTYLAQRAESLAGLLLFLTLYCYLRGAAQPEAAGPNRFWLAAAVASCLAGMAAKETMVVAPLIVLLHDRTFIADSWGAAWRTRGRWLAALAATWLLLAWLVMHTGNRGGTAGYGSTLTTLDYAQFQPRAILHYLRLAFWPSPLVFDYGEIIAQPAGGFISAAVILALLAGGTLWAVLRRPALGFAGAAFFLLLAPSSSLVPVVTQTMAEHRLYAPLAAVAALTVTMLYRIIGRYTPLVILAVVPLLAYLTYQRNGVYQSELALWRDTAEKAPGNPRAFINLGSALDAAGRRPEALEAFARGLALQPMHPEGRHNYGLALLRSGRLREAVEQFTVAIRQNPRLAPAHFDLGNALAADGQYPAAVAAFHEALRLRPDYPEARINLGSALYHLGRLPEAEALYRGLLLSRPDSVEAHTNLANVLFSSGRTGEAFGHYDQALRLAPAHPGLRLIYGSALASAGRPVEAAGQYRAALRLQPDNVPALRALGALLYQTGDLAGASEALEQALRLQPSQTDTAQLLALIRSQQNR